MKIRKILFTLIVAFFLVAAIGCKDKNGNNKGDKFTPTAISTVLTTYKNNQDTQVEGVVYGVVKNGFYIADSNDAGVFVVMGDTWTANVAIGDKVQVTGQFSISNNFLQVKNVSKTTVVSNNNTSPVTASELTIDEVNKIDSTKKTGSYAKLVTVTATVEKNTAGNVILKDESGKSVLVQNHSNTLINNYNQKRIKVTVVTYRFDTTASCWIVSFAGTENDIEDAALTFETIVSMAKEHISSVVPSEIFGALELPEAHPVLNYVTYTWTVENNEWMKIEGTKVRVVIDEVDHTVEFSVAISDGTNTEVVKYSITSKAIVEQTISNLLNNMPTVDMSTVLVSGIVVAATRNQSLSLRTLVLQDPTTKETLMVDFSNADNEYISNLSETFKAVKLGDEIKVTGQFDNGERKSIENVSALVVKSTGNPVIHDIENAYELSTQEDYDNLGTNYRDYVGKLVKIVNPYMNYSTSSTPSESNWVRFGYDTNSGNLGFGVSGDTHIFAFLIAAQNESLGGESWHKNYDIPFINAKEGAKQYQVTYYVYPTYFEGSTYLQFIIPSVECIEVVGVEKINLDINSTVPTYVDSANTTKLNLLLEHPTVGTITWNSSNEAAISTDGTVSAVTKSTNVTLTASYQYNGNKEEVQFTVVVLPSEGETIDSILTYAEETYVKFTGVVVSYVSDGNTVESRNGVLVLDKNTGKTILVTNLTAIEGTIGNYKDVLGTEIKIGDEISAIGKYSLNSAAIGSGPAQDGRVSIELSSESMLKVETSGVEFDYHLENAKIVTNYEELKALSDEVEYGTVIKLVGTKENPIYIGGSSSKSPFNLKVFYTATGAPSSAANDAKFNGQIFSLKSDVVGYTWGDTWYTEIFGIAGPFVGPNSSNSGVAIVGEIYVSVAYRTSTYFQMCAVAVDQWNVSRDGTLQDVKDLLDAVVPGAVENGKADFALPTKTLYTPNGITWASSDPTIFDIETMTATSALADTQVTLIATFELNGEEQVLRFVLTVQGLGEPELVSISTLLSTAKNETVQKVEGIVASYHSDGNTSGDLRGIILIEPVTGELLLVDGIQKLTPEGQTYTHGTYYTSDGTVLEIGDKVEILGTFMIDGTRKSMLITDSATVTVVSKGNEITYGAPKVTISTNDEMTAFVKNIQVGVLVKFVGTAENPFCFGGSSSDASKINYKFFYNASATDNNGTKYGGKTFSFKGVVNIPTLGDNWWNEYFGLPAGFVGPKDGETQYKYSGEIYAVVTAVTSTYYQMSFVNTSAISATLLTA